MKLLKLNKKDGKLLSIHWSDWGSEADLKRDIAEINKIPIHDEVYKNATPFQVKVWKACSKIPAGKTITYKQLAQAIGNPKASRAVGTALGKNPVLYKIPCHRVLNTSGKLGGYSCKFGLKAKKLLLSIEGA